MKNQQVVLPNYSIQSILKIGRTHGRNLSLPRIAEGIRQDILEGCLKSGERLLALSEMSGCWCCTSRIVQRANQYLARQGLVISRPGKGTSISTIYSEAHSQGPLWRAALFNRAEPFMLEVLTAGYSLGEVQRTLDLAVGLEKVQTNRLEMSRSNGCAQFQERS